MQCFYYYIFWQIHGICLLETLLKANFDFVAVGMFFLHEVSIPVCATIVCLPSNICRKLKEVVIFIDQF